MKLVRIGLLMLLGYKVLAQNIDTKVQLYGEILENCGDNEQLDKSLHWYGIYFTERNGEILKKIDPETLDASRRGKLSNETGQTDKNGNFLFYIGISKAISEKRVSFLGVDWTKQHKILYPGEHHTLYIGGQSTSSSLEIFATGSVTDISYCPIIENYSIKITSSIQNTTTLRQEVYTDIETKGECGLVEIKWFGDLDDDQKVDFLLATSSTQGTEISLFLSGQASESPYVKFADNFHYGNCY